MVIIPLCLGYIPSKAGFKLLPHNNLENYMKLIKKKKIQGKQMKMETSKNQPWKTVNL